MTDVKQIPIQYMGPGPDAVECGSHTFDRDGEYIDVDPELAQLLLVRGDFRKKGQAKDAARKHAADAQRKQQEELEQAEQQSAADQTPTTEPSDDGEKEA